MERTVFTSTQYDGSTGEVTKNVVIKKKVKTQEQFVQAYCEDLGSLLKCSNGQINLLIALINLQYIEFNTNEIVVTPARRDIIAEKINLSTGAIYNAISALKKKNIILNDGKQMFLNPKLFFYGSELAREKMFQLSIDYTICEDC
jgi:fructose/tagatose bisphosphate aldolase